MLVTAPRYSFAALLALSISMIFATGAYSQSTRNKASQQVKLKVEAIAILSLDDTSLIELSVAQNPLYQTAGTERATTTLHYTIINESGMTRQISVQWDTRDAAPSGTSLRIVATHIPENCGTAAPEVKVSSVPQFVVSGIPSCATGTGPNGVTLLYRLVMDEKTKVQGGNESMVTIYYTISES